MKADVDVQAALSFSRAASSSRTQSSTLWAGVDRNIFASASLDLQMALTFSFGSRPKAGGPSKASRTANENSSAGAIFISAAFCSEQRRREPAGGRFRSFGPRDAARRACLTFTNLDRRAAAENSGRTISRRELPVRRRGSRSQCRVSYVNVDDTRCAISPKVVVFPLMTVVLRVRYNPARKVSLSHLMDHPPPIMRLADERVVAVLAIHTVAIRSRLSRASDHLRRPVGRSELRLLLSEPELVRTAQEQ